MYKISQEQKLYFASVLLLENMGNLGQIYSLLLDGDDEMLEDTFIHMVSKTWVIPGDKNYEITDKGIEVLRNYLNKLEEFRSVYKVFSAVDLTEGQFAYEQYYDFETDNQFSLLINEERFEDLRVAVCELKGQDPMEMVFLEFVDTGRFDVESNTWQADLTTGLIWDEITEIVNSHIKVSDLGDDKEEITGEDMLSVIITEGVKLMIELKKQEAEEDEEDEEFEDGVETITVEEPVFEVEYYESYYDPFYVSPCFGVVYW